METQKINKYLNHLPSNSVDWATAVVDEADRELTCVTLIYHNSDTIYETSAQSTKSPGIKCFDLATLVSFHTWVL